MQGIPFVSQPAFELEYKGRKLGQFFKPDFVCYEKIIVELKTLERLVDVCRAQVINYLSASSFDLGILVNFGHFPKLEYERIANNRNRGTMPSVYSRMANRLEGI